jgi:hypothetical protein
VARPWFVAVGVVAAITGLIALPWSLAVRLSIIAGLLLLGLGIGVYQLGIRRGRQLFEASEGAARRNRSLAASHWSREDLVDATFIKVATPNGMVMLCWLREDGSVLERFLPRSASEAHAYDQSWGGSWNFRDGELSIFVNGFHLALHPSLKGTWAGKELFGAAQHDFVGCVADSRPIAEGEPWVGLKLGAGRSFRHLVIATEDGRLRETDPYEKGDYEAEGSWDVPGGSLRLDLAGESVTTEQLMPGVRIAMRRGSTEFALVRVRHTGG